MGLQPCPRTQRRPVPPPGTVLRREEDGKDRYQAVFGKACFLPPVTVTVAATRSASAAHVREAAPRPAMSRPPRRPPAAMDAEMTVMTIDWATSAASREALIAAPMNKVEELPKAKPQAPAAM